MKKGAVVTLVIVVLVLCVLALACGAGIWYLFLMQTPDRAFDKAFDTYENGDYYQYTDEGSIEATAYGESLKYTADGEGKVDIQNDKSYYKSTSQMEGATSTTETYTLGNDRYTNVDGGEFSKDTMDDDYTQMEDVLLDAAKNVEYELLDEEEVDGEACYQYEVKLSEKHVLPYAEEFSRGMDEGSSVSDHKVKSAHFVVWVSKSDSKIVKLDMVVEEMEFKVNLYGEKIDIEINMESSTMYKDWGTEVSIEKPK